MFLINIFMSLNLAFAATNPPPADVAFQDQIDKAYGLIFKTQIGQTICRDILGADAEAITLHLGVTLAKARVFASECSSGFEPAEWVYPTSPSDIQKISHAGQRPKKYVLQISSQAFPLESWTDPVSNSTTIMTLAGETLTFGRLVQILAHETAVYFDSKTNPAHPSAESITTLRDLKLNGPGLINPLVAVTNPLIGHTLTYLRALQVEFAIMDELVAKGALHAPDSDTTNDDFEAPADFYSPALRYLISNTCGHSCIASLVTNLRDEYLPIALPMLAFANNYRALILGELPKLNLQWNNTEMFNAQVALNTYPVLYLKTQFTGDVVADMNHVFSALDQGEKAKFDAVTLFMKNDLWPIEWPTVSESRFDSGQTLLEFMKRPLLSGYNIMLTSGPRVRVRTGIVQ